MELNFNVKIDSHIIETIDNIIFYEYKPFKQNKDM